MLFRSEVVDHIAGNGGQGQVLLRNPGLFWFFSLLACVFSLALLGLLFFGKHTQNARVTGQLTWDQALSLVASPTTATVQQIQIKESNQVMPGQILFVLLAAGKSYPVYATQAATVGMLLVKPGQYVEVGQTLAQLIPNQARIQAEIKVPANALPYLREGQVLPIRIEAFPYQKFGMFNGVVSDIARVALADQQGEKKYRVIVKMEQQQASYFGKGVAFQADMQVDTELPLYQHSLLDSMFEPLLAMKGKV